MVLLERFWSGLTEADEARGRAISASTRLERAALYLFTAERMQGHGARGRQDTYAKALAAFAKAGTFGTRR